MKRLYLFDFDGTLTNKDTLFDFLQFSFPQKFRKAFIKFILLFFLVRVRILKGGKVKEKFISYFLKGKNKSEIEKLTQSYFEARKEIIFRPKAREYINNLAHETDKYIVTASPDIWVKPFAKHLGVRLISTEAEFKNNIFTGKFATPNCNHQEKSNRVVKEIQLSRFKEIYAFGDSKGDKYLLKLATHPHYRYFE